MVPRPGSRRQGRGSPSPAMPPRRLTPAGSSLRAMPSCAMPEGARSPPPPPYAPSPRSGRRWRTAPPPCAQSRRAIRRPRMSATIQPPNAPIPPRFADAYAELQAIADRLKPNTARVPDVDEIEPLVARAQELATHCEERIAAVKRMLDQQGGGAG